MVKVISTDPHRSVVKEIVCKNCGATLQYVPKDIESERHYDYLGDSDEYRFIKCPPCGNKVGVGR
jgi:DNA-directed RNA polymerase subunit RPC12/RpoP